MKISVNSGFTVKPLYPLSQTLQTAVNLKPSLEQMSNDDIDEYGKKSVGIAGLIFAASKFSDVKDLGNKIFKPEHFSEGTALRKIYDTVSKQALDMDACYAEYSSLDFDSKKNIVEALLGMDDQMLKVLTKKIATDMKSLAENMEQIADGDLL